MKQYINKNDIVAEIKRMRDKAFPNSDWNHGYVKACESIISLLDTLEVKEVDLDYIKKELDELIRFCKPNGDFGWGTLYNVATHFYELGIKSKGE